MTKYQQLAYRLRWLLLILAVGCICVWCYLMFMGMDKAWSSFCIYLTILFFVQWLYLRPRRGWVVKLTMTTRPMKSSILAAAFVAALLTTGIGFTLFEIAVPPTGGTGVMATPPVNTAPPETVWTQLADVISENGLIIILITLWSGWALVFYLYWRQGDHYTQHSRMIRGLLAGTFLELLMSIGVYVWNPHNNSCECSRGSWVSLILGGTVAVWAFGPGLILLFMRERYRRALCLPICTNCGYDLRGSVAAGQEQCPECGKAIHLVIDAGQALPPPPNCE